MSTQELEVITDTIEQDQELIEALEAVLEQYRAWRRSRTQIKIQIFRNFRLAPFPTSDQVCDILQHFQVFADALTLIGNQIEEEIEETIDKFYTWCYD